MNLLALGLLVAGICTAFVSSVWFVIVAFRRHIAWGLAVLLLPFANLIFLICEWADAKRPFYFTILGCALCLAVALSAPDQKWRETLRSRIAQRITETRETTPPVDARQSESAPPDGLTELRTREQALRARKTSLDPRDAAAVAALTRDIAAYNDDLKAHSAAVALEKTEAPPASLWVDDVAQAHIPAAPARGAIGGEPFTVERAVIENGILSLRHGTGFFADHEFVLFLFLNGRSPAGRNFQIKPESSAGSLHVHMKWLAKNQKLPETQAFINGYGLRLEFGERSGNELPGRIYLCMPDAAKSYLAGTFRARIVDKGGVAMAR
jgi:hypothetical protein